MSAAVTSFCRSTNCLGARDVPRGCGTSHSGRMLPLSSLPSPSSLFPSAAMAGEAASAATVAGAAGVAPKPAASAAAAPARWPLETQSCKPCRPAQAPAERSACTGGPGTNAASTSFHTGLPPDWQCRWITGLKPPDTASRSHFNTSAAPASRPCASSVWTLTERTSRPPQASVTTAAARTAMPAATARACSAPSGTARASTTCTAAPALCKASAAS